MIKRTSQPNVHVYPSVEAEGFRSLYRANLHPSQASWPHLDRPWSTYRSCFNFYVNLQGSRCESVHSWMPMVTQIPRRRSIL